MQSGITLSKDLDYLAARLHGRRSRLADGDRLQSFSSLKSVPDLANLLFPKIMFETPSDLQRRMVRDLALEMDGILHHLTGTEARLMEWFILRFHVENLKTLLRGILAKIPPATLERHLITFPDKRPLDWATRAKSAKSMDALARLIPDESLRRMLSEARAVFPDRTEPFFIETALDESYFAEGLARAKALPSTDRELITALVSQESKIFHLMLTRRGKLEGDSPDAAALERLAWQHYLRLANRAFRRSLTPFGTITGYIGLRRMETANLITLSEGIRLQMTDDSIQRRMISPLPPEAPHV
jgi:vacuolar-type H+-ATPase subunit C/Vma6